MQVAVLLIGVAAILVYTRWFVADPKDAKDDKMSKRSREDVDDSSDEEAKSGGGNEPERVVKRLRTLETSLNLIRKALLDDDSGTNKADTATLDQLVAMRRDIDALSTKLQAAHGSDANIERVAEAIRNILEESQKKLRDQIALHDKVLAEQPKRVANVTAELRANLNRQAERLADLRSEVERSNSKLGELALLVEGDGKKIDTDRAKLAELTKRHDDLEQSIRSLRDLLDQDEVEDETLGRRVAEISLRLTRLDGAASGTSKRVGEIEVVAKTANERIDALTTSTTQRLADLETNVTKVATEVATEEVRKTNERVAEMDVATAKRLTDLESNVTRLEDQELAKTNERVERLEQLDSTISTRLSGLENNVTKVSGEDIVEGRKKMEMIDTRVVALEDRGKQHEDKLEDVENRLSGAEKQLVKCCSNVHNLFTDHKTHALTQAELFENRYAVVEKNGTELRQQVDAYKKKLEDQEVRQNRLEQDELTLRTRVDVCERTGQDLNNHIEKQDARNETTVKELHELDKRTGTLEKQTADTDALVQRHDTHLVECEKALRVLESETRSNRSACDAANTEIVETVREQAQKISAFESQTTELKMHASECDKRFDEIGGRVQQTSEKLVAVEVALQTRVNETEKQMERLTTRTQTYAEQLSGLDAQTKGMRGELDGTAQRLTNAEQSVRDWRQQVERQLVEIEPLPEKMEALRQTVNQTDTTLAAKLDEQIRRADKNEETCQRETNALRRDIVENDTLAKQLQKRIDKIESAASELNKSSELHAIKLSQLSALHDANAPQMKKMADLEHDSVQLAQDVAELQKRSAELQEEVKLLHSKENERKAQDAHHATIHAEEVARLREEFSGGVERSEKAIRDDLRALAATAERDSASRVDLVNKVDALTVEVEDKPTRAEFELVKTELKNNLDQLTSNVSQQKDTNQRAEDQERQLHALRAELTAQSASLIGLRGELNTLDLPQVRSVTEQLRQWREKTDRILDRFIVQVEKAEKAEADAAAAAALTKEAAKSDSALPTGATVGTPASTGTNGASCEAVKAELEELSEKVEKKLSGLAEKAAEKEKTEKERVERERDAKEIAEKEKALARLVRSVSPTRVEENTAAIKRIDESVIKLTKTDLPELREELNRGDKAVRRLTDEDLPKLREELMKNNANALESAIKTLSANQDSLRERMLVQVKNESAKKMSEALHKLGEVRNVSRETTLRTALKSMQNDIDKATRKLLSSRDALHNTAQKELRDGLRDELQKRIETAITELAHKQDELREKTLSVVQQNEKKEHDRTRSDIVSLRSKIESAESELKKRIAEDKKVNDQLSSLRKTIDREKSDILSHLTKKLRESTSEHESKWSSAITAAKKAIAKDRDASRDADLAELHTKTKKECTERIEKALAQAKHDCTEHQSKLRESVEQASKALLDKTARELVKKRDDSRAKVLAEMSTRLEKHCNESLTAAAAKIRTEATAIVAKETTKMTGEISKHVDTELSKSHKSADEALQKGLKTLRTDLEKRVDGAVSKMKSDRDASRKKSLQDLQTALKKHVADELKLWNDKRDKTETDRVRRTIEYYKYTTNESLDDTFKKRDEKRKEQIAAAQTETTKKVTAELQKSLTKRDEEAKKTTEQIRADFKKAIETAIAKVHSERNESRAKAFKEKLADTLESTENNSGKKMNEKDTQTMRALIQEQMNVFALSLTTSILRDFHLVTEHVESELKQFREERKKYTKQELMHDHEQRAKQLERDSRLAAIEHLLGRNFDNVPLNTYVATIVHKELDREQRLPSSDTQAIRKAITRYGSFDAFLDRRINQFLRSHFSPEDVEDILRVRDNDFVYDMKKKIVELEEQVKNLLKGESKRADDASTVRSQFLRFEERFLTTFNELESRIEKRYDIKKPVLAQTDRGRLMDLEHKLAESEQERKKLDERLQFLEHVFNRFKELRKIDSPLKAFNLVDDWTTKTT